MRLTLAPLLLLPALTLGGPTSEKIVVGEPSTDELWAQARARLAPTGGELKVKGLKAPVEVIRDNWGIPHIYAQNQDDLFFAQGFVAAQDRLFQIEMWRRHAAGEMAEIFGPAALESDRFARLIRYRGDMEAEWTSYSPDTKAIATAFTQGINACIDQLGDKLPIEFELLRFKPKHWAPEDILHRMSGIYMSQNFKNEVARAKLVAAVGSAKARKLAPVDPSRDYEPALPADDVAEIGRVLDGYNAATKMLNFKPPKTESNNWVVSKGLSASGMPMLASDPHRALALPSLRYIVHLHAPGWHVIGAGEPALPGVALGHNDRIAWGITIVGVDQADIYVEELNPENPRLYKADGKWLAMEETKNDISVQFADGSVFVVKYVPRYTRHGPVLHVDEKRHRAYVLKWVGHEPGGAGYLGGLAVSRAKDQKSFLKALESWKIPGLNFVYADVDGNTGWIGHATAPVRAKHDGLLPVPGDAGFDWKGRLAVAEEPQSWNPKSGWLGTANHNILPKGYPHLFGFEFAPSYRFDRIKLAMETKKKWSLKEFQALQHDEVSIPGQILSRLLRDEKLDEPRLKSCIDLLSAWDGSLSIDAAAGPLFAHWLKELQNDFYGRHVPKELRADLISLSGLPVMLKALEEADPFWLGPEPKVARRDILLTALEKAEKKLRKLPKEQQDRWGALHTASFPHPLADRGKAFAEAFNLGPVERGGDSQTPNNTRYDDKFRQMHGATYRQLFDLSDWDLGLATLTPGQSGQAASPHYGDLLPLWARGEYFPLAFSRAKVDGVARSRLLLTP